MNNIATKSQAALKPYSRLRNIVLSLKDAQPAAEGAAPHLVDYTEKLASTLRQQMKNHFGSRLQKTLEQMKWPTRELNITDNLLAQWSQDVGLLLDLQTPYVSSLVTGLVFSNDGLVSRELRSRDTLSPGQSLEPPVLFPLEVMVHPLDLRFKYHFSGDKPTNRLDKVGHLVLVLETT